MIDAYGGEPALAAPNKVLYVEIAPSFTHPLQVQVVPLVGVEAVLLK
jgi:hypothetical protein